LISYYVPETVGSAQLSVTDVNGYILKTITLAKGNGQTTVDAETLTSGSYFYSLIIDGQKIDTKQMVLVK